jgi:hypothetical protein
MSLITAPSASAVHHVRDPLPDRAVLGLKASDAQRHAGTLDGPARPVEPPVSFVAVENVFPGANVGGVGRPAGRRR